MAAGSVMIELFIGDQDRSGSLRLLSPIEKIP